MYKSLCICIYLCVYAYISLHICIYLCLYLYICTYMYICIYLYICVFVYMHISVYICIYLCVYAYISVYRYIYLCVYVYISPSPEYLHLHHCHILIVHTVFENNCNFPKEAAILNEGEIFSNIFIYFSLIDIGCSKYKTSSF